MPSYKKFQFFDWHAFYNKLLLFIIKNNIFGKQKATILEFYQILNSTRLTLLIVFYILYILKITKKFWEIHAQNYKKFVSDSCNHATKFILAASAKIKQTRNDYPAQWHIFCGENNALASAASNLRKL